MCAIKENFLPKSQISCPKHVIYDIETMIYYISLSLKVDVNVCVLLKYQ